MKISEIRVGRIYHMVMPSENEDLEIDILGLVLSKGEKCGVKLLGGNGVLHDTVVTNNCIGWLATANEVNHFKAKAIKEAQIRAAEEINILFQPIATDKEI